VLWKYILEYNVDFGLIPVGRYISWYFYVGIPPGGVIVWWPLNVNTAGNAKAKDIKYKLLSFYHYQVFAVHKSIQRMQ
jgi:hypothetical protein